MLGPLVSMKIKAAEEALDAGRIDEACELLAAPDVREHRRAQSVRDRVNEALLKRARGHEDAGRYAAALADLDKALAVGADPAKVNALREWVRGLMRADLDAQQAQRERLATARDRIDAGSLAGAREALAGLDAQNARVGDLLSEADRREHAARRSVEEAERFMAAGQWAPACRALETARQSFNKLPGLVETETRLTGAVVDRVRDALTHGQIEFAVDLLAQLGTVGRALPQRAQVERLLAIVRNGTDAVAHADWSTARREALRLRAEMPDVEWVSRAAEQLDQIEELAMALHAGPLGSVVPPSAPLETSVAARTERVASPPAHASGSGAYDRTRPRRLIIDGVGSTLLLAKDRVAIGRMVGGTDAPDIALMADLSSVHAEIFRVDDDYFFIAHKPASINGRPVEKHLLEDGDRIELGSRVRMTFRLPSRRSSSAVVEMGGSLRMPGDVRRVVLFDRYATLGPTTKHHVTLPPSAGSYTVFERGGGLYVRPMAGSSGGSEEMQLPDDGTPVELGSVRMVLAE